MFDAAIGVTRWNLYPRGILPYPNPPLPSGRLWYPIPPVPVEPGRYIEKFHDADGFVRYDWLISYELYPFDIEDTWRETLATDIDFGDVDTKDRDILDIEGDTTDTTDVFGLGFEIPENGLANDFDGEMDGDILDAIRNDAPVIPV